jgi:hypothetical protein
MKKLLLSFVFWAIATGVAMAEPQATISWLPNSEPDIDGYRLYQSVASGVYDTAPVYIAPVTSHSITVFLPQQRCTVRYFWVVTAFDLLGQEKDVIGTQYWIGACKKQ